MEQEQVRLEKGGERQIEGNVREIVSSEKESRSQSNPKKIEILVKEKTNVDMQIRIEIENDLELGDAPRTGREVLPPSRVQYVA
jgi:hypothetical protein